MKPLFWAAVALTLLSSAPAAADECTACPRVQLLRAADQVRIAAEDDEDAYEDLQHRVRFVTAAGVSGWTAWASTNAYGLRTSSSGRVEAETIDLEGNIGRGVITITAPKPTEEGSRGPGTVEEDSSAEAQWEGGYESDGTTAADLPEQEAGPNAEEWLEAQEWDHSVCPVSSADSDAACSTTDGATPKGPLGALLLLAALGLARSRR